jgi:hypothetical protein
MPSFVSDLVPMMIAVGAVLFIVVITSQVLNHYRSRTPRLRMLTGTRTQRAALRLALTPVLQEFLPLLDKTGPEVRAIVVVPTLSGSDGEPLAAEVEQLTGSATFILRLAHRLGTTIRQPDDVAGVLAEDLLYLFRHAASATVVRQTPAPMGQEPAPQPAAVRKPVGRNGLSSLPRQAAQNEAEETVVAFKASPLGHTNNQGS